MNDLRVTLVQTNLYWEDAGANLAMLEEQIRPLAGSTDVIILPEMFTTGFSMNPKPLAEPMNLRTTRWMHVMAEHTGALVLGSFIAGEGGQCFNRLVWMEPGGKSFTYDKKHLFRMAGEDKVYASGNHVLIGQWKGWNIRPLICYDLRFPVWSRNRRSATDGSPVYDLLIYVANWPAVRATAWETLLRARAIENLTYVAAVNRIGEDGNGVVYNGLSQVIGPRGEILNRLEGVSGTPTVVLSAQELLSHREKFPAHLDADQFSLS